MPFSDPVFINETPQELHRGAAQKSSLAEAASSVSELTVYEAEGEVNTNNPVGAQKTVEVSGEQC